jgi:CBS domain-containing protein
MSMSAFLEGKAGEYMTRKVTTVTRDMTLDELEALFEALDFNSFPVVEDGRMVGIVTKFDFLKAFAFTTSQMVPRYEELMLGTVGETMTETVVDVQPDVPLTRVLQLMVNFRARSFPVTDGAGMLVGMISREDLMRALRDAVPPPV